MRLLRAAAAWARRNRPRNAQQKLGEMSNARARPKEWGPVLSPATSRSHLRSHRTAHSAAPRAAPSAAPAPAPLEKMAFSVCGAAARVASASSSAGSAFSHSSSGWPSTSQRPPRLLSPERPTPWILSAGILPVRHQPLFSQALHAHSDTQASAGSVCRRRMGSPAGQVRFHAHAGHLQGLGRHLV